MRRRSVTIQYCVRGIPGTADRYWSVAQGKALTLDREVHFASCALFLSGPGSDVFNGNVTGYDLEVSGATATFAGTSNLTVTVECVAGAWAAGALNWNSSGTLSVTWLWSAWRGQGVITQTAGTVDVYYLDFGLPITSAVYNLDGGELWVSAMGYAASPGYNAPATLNFGGGTLVATADFTPTASSGYALLYTIDEGATAYIDTNGYDVTLPGPISGLGGLEKLGSGTLTLSGANTYTGGTFIDEGTLAVGNADAIPAGADKGDVEVDGTLDLNGQSITINGLSGSGTVTTSDSGRSDLTVGANDQLSTFDGVIEDGSGTVGLLKTGDGTLKLTGANTYTGGNTPLHGTLVIGHMDSVFKTSLADGLTFSTVRPDGRLVADPGTSGGTFGLTVPALSDGYVLLCSDGILEWEPGTNCQPGSYAAVATFACTGNFQATVFTLSTENEDLPPAFTIDNTNIREQWWHGHDGDYYNCYPSLYLPQTPGVYEKQVQLPQAFDREGAVTYELMADVQKGERLPLDAEISDSAVLTCDFTSPDDGYQVYQFDVKATDSDGNVDVRHMVLGVQVLYQGWAATQIAVNTYAHVDQNSTQDRIPVVNDLQTMYTSSGTLVIDQQPAHGSAQLDPNYFGCVLYTPTQGYRGLDQFKYHWEYNKLDYWTMQFTGYAATNVCYEQVQVGNWVDIEPAAPYSGRSAVLAIGETTTATLTLQNPRGDGVPTTGYWTLCYNDSVIDVFDADGNYLAPPGYAANGWSGRTVLEEVAGEEAVTLTVKGVAGGDSDLVAYWYAWAGTPGWHWYTCETCAFYGNRRESPCGGFSRRRGRSLPPRGPRSEPAEHPAGLVRHMAVGGRQLRRQRHRPRRARLPALLHPQRPRRPRQDKDRHNDQALGNAASRIDDAREGGGRHRQSADRPL